VRSRYILISELSGNGRKETTPCPLRNRDILTPDPNRKGRRLKRAEFQE
jgi:hypothetical protein